MIQIEAPIVNPLLDNSGNITQMWLMFFQSLGKLQGKIEYSYFDRGVVVNIGMLSFFRLDVDVSDSESSISLKLNETNTSEGYFTGFLNADTDTMQTRFKVENDNLIVPYITQNYIVSGFLIRRKEEV